MEGRGPGKSQCSRTLCIPCCDFYRCFFLCHAARLMLNLARPSSQRVVIIDTDAGSDDLMAISFLLSRPDIRVEAITIVNGMAQRPGGRPECFCACLGWRGRHENTRVSWPGDTTFRERGIPPPNGAAIRTIFLV